MDAYAKFGWTDKKYYGIFQSGLLAFTSVSVLNLPRKVFYK